MALIEKLTTYTRQYLKMLSLWDIRNYLSRKQLLKVGIALALNVWNSVAKILAPASLAKAVEMIAMSKDEEDFGPLFLEPKHLLYISVFLTVWVKSEIYLKKFLVRDVESLIVEKNVMQIIKMTHEMELQSHVDQQFQIIKVITDIINIQSKLSTEVISVISQTLLDITIGTTLIWNRYGTLIGAEFLLYSLIDIVLLTHIVEFLTAQSKHFTKMNSVLQKFINREFEVMSFEETVRMMNHGSLEVELSEILLTKYLTATNNYKFSDDIASALKLIPFFIANIIPVSFIFKDNISIRDLDDFVFLLSYLNIFGGNILTLTQSIKSARRAIISIEEMKILLSENLASPGYPQGRLSIERPIGNFDYPSPEIMFNNVYFTYPKRFEPTLKGISIRISPGRKIGIIGHSNAGKSTIVKLLYGIYHPEVGTITINGINIEHIPREVLMRIFCCVPQKIDLFTKKSLKYNVVYGSSDDSLIKNCLLKRPDIIHGNEKDYETFDQNDSEEEKFSSTYHKTNKLFAKAMKKAKLENLIAVSDEIGSANTLSGGQRQRVNIARALIRNSPIFIFDEATNSLDENTKQEILDNIWEISKGKTTLMITHDLATIENVDEVIMLHNGEITHRGSPENIFGRRQL